MQLLPQLPYPQNNNIPKKKFDTLCYKIHFDKGDTLIYNVFSFDSISIDYEKPLKRIRLEKYRVVCENVDRNNRFHLSLELIDYKAKESFKDKKNVEITETLWLHRKVRLIIDSLGDRYYSPENDTTHYAMSPGGSFQPIFFLPFLRGCKPINTTWIVQSTDTLVENGCPVPLMKQVSLFRLHPVADTLGWKCAKLEYVKSGQGVVLASKAGVNLNVTSIINSYGEYYISLDRHIPIYLFATVEQKLTLFMPWNKTKPGVNHISSHFTLEKIIKAKKKN
jgi:hypothetical protein